MDENRIELLVKKVAQKIDARPTAVPKEAALKETTASVPVQVQSKDASKLSTGDYPLAQKHPELIKSYTGKHLGEITLDKVADGEISPDDIRISADVLECQAQIAEFDGKKQFAMNLRRAAELTRIPDEKVLEIYNLLRPGRATRQKLLDMARELEDKYGAVVTAKLVKDAALVYEERNILLKE